jgi:hypothetical protein
MKKLSKDKAGGGGLNGQVEPDAYFIRGEDLPWRRHECKKENELVRCFRHRMTVQCRFSLVLTKYNSLKLCDFFIFFCHQPPTFENGLYPGNELPGTEGLWRAVVRSSLNFSFFI